MPTLVNGSGLWPFITPPISRTDSPTELYPLAPRHTNSGTVVNLPWITSVLSVLTVSPKYRQTTFPPNFHLAANLAVSSDIPKLRKGSYSGIQRVDKSKSGER